MITHTQGMRPLGRKEPMSRNTKAFVIFLSVSQTITNSLRDEGTSLDLSGPGVLYVKWKHWL